MYGEGGSGGGRGGGGGASAVGDFGAILFGACGSGSS